MRYLDRSPGHLERLPALGTQPAGVHVFDVDSIEALNAALGAGRPLLVRGEPGTGKSQLARAAAVALGRAFLGFTVDARTEARDLLFTVDAVARLAEAQILGHLPRAEVGDVRERLAEIHFTSPGPLWWLLDWASAQAQTQQVVAGELRAPWTPAGWNMEDGVVLLIDEIDKADSAVPNGLLEALGQNQFRGPAGLWIAAEPGVEPPLVVITTNEERVLPDAFVRRCLVLQLGWPAAPEEFVTKLMERGRAHFAADEEVLRTAAQMVRDDRSVVARRGLCPPGGAEYLDLLRAVVSRWPGQTAHQLEALARIRTFALDKHPRELSE